MTFKTSYAVLI